MRKQILFEISVVCLSIFVSYVICGRIPVGIHRVDLAEDPISLQSSEEYLDLDGPHSEDTGVYVTDVQIDELQNAQEKISKQDQQISEVYEIYDEKSPRIAVDWIALLGEPKSATLSDQTKRITIQGGCTVTQKQRKSLDLFLKYGHVKKCVCMHGDFVCYVRK